MPYCVTVLQYFSMFRGGGEMEFRLMTKGFDRLMVRKLHETKNKGFEQNGWMSATKTVSECPVT